jgi:hypothetical protein
MTLNNAIDVLSKYSRWRKGLYVHSPSPQEFGIAIDIVLERLTVKKEKNRRREVEK